MRRSLILVVFALFFAAIPARAQQPFVGQIDIVGFTFPPVGWATCDGSLMPIQNDEALFDLIGTTYGGNGETTFALPDLRGRMAIGQGQGPGMQSYLMGEQIGVESVTLTLNQMPAHTHTAMGSSAADSLGPGNTMWGTTTTYLYSSTDPALVAMNGAVVGTAGGGQPHNNMPPFLVMNFIISLYGVFPTMN